VAHPKQPDPESLRLELQEAITTFRHQIALLMQGIGFVVAADAILLAYAFSQRLSGVLLIASFMPIAILLLFGQTMTGLVPVCYVAMKLERKLSLLEQPLIETWIKTRDDLPFSSTQDIDNVTDSDINAVLSSFLPWWVLKSRKSMLLLLIFAVQFCIFLVGLLCYHYRFM